MLKAANLSWAILLRICALGLFVVTAIIYWGAWTPTTANGLLAAGLACFVGSFLTAPEAMGGFRGEERTVVREEPKVYGDETVAPRHTREGEYTRR